MADESMLSLFDTDAGFLDELTGGGDSGIGGAGTGMEGSLLGPNTGLGGMQGDSLMNSLTQPTQSTGIQGGFGSSHSQQMSSISGNQYSGLSYQSSNAAPSQFSAGGFGSQYNSQKLHHLNTANQMVAIGAGGQSQQGMMISQNQQQLSQPQFGSPPAGGAMIGQPQQQGARYQSFGVGNQTGVVGPRLPNPHQQIGMPTQNNMWSNSQTSPNQTSTNFIHQQHALGQIQRQPGPQQTQMPLLQQQVGAGSQQQMSTQYLTHHDYALNKSSSSMPTVSRYNQDINPNQANAFMQRMTSPPAATNRLSNVPMTASNAMNSFGQMQQQPFQQPHLGTQQARMPGFSANTNMPGMSQPQQQQYSGSYVHQRPQANSAGVSSGNFTNFPFQQQTSQIPVSQGMGDGTSRLSHYQNTSPNHSSQFLAGFPTLPQQRATTPSPRPTPPLKPTPPPSHTPDLPTQHTSPTSQGTVRQSTLQQQMELMSPPPGNSSTSSSPYHCSDASNSSLSQTPVKSSSFPTPVVSQLPASNNMVSVGGGVNTMNVSTTLPNFVNTSLPSVNTSLPNFVNTSLPNRTNIGIGPISPNVNNISIGQGIVNPQSISMEIQRLQQQLQQVHSLPQTNQTQQNMLDLQERIRTLRAKQELHLQRQKQLQQQSTGLQQNVQQNLQPQQQQQKQVVFQIPGMQQQQQNVQTIGNVQANMTGGQNVHQPIQIGQLQPTQQMQQQTQPQTVLIVTSNDGNKLQQQTVQMVPQGMQQVASKPQQFQQVLQTSQQPQFNQGVGGVASQNLQVVIQSQQQQQQSLQLTQTPQAPSQLLSPHQVPTSTSNVPQQSQMTGNQATSSLTAPNLHLQTNNTPTQNQVLPVSSSTNIGNMPVIQLQLGTNSHGGTVQMMPKSEEQNEMIDSMNIEGEGGGEVTKLKKAQQQQEKANRIVAEAVARAAAAGNKSLPPLITSSSAGNGIPSTVCDVQTPEILTEDGSTKKKKKKRERKPKEPKEPKTPKTPKVKKAKVEKLNTSSEIDVIGTSSEEKVEKTPAEKKEKKPKAEKPKSSIKKKKKPPATFLKKKKKRGGSSDGSDVEIKITPPPSPTEDDGIQKRRSARNTKRKKYLDDVDLNLSDDDHHHNVDVEGTDGAVLRPVDVLTVDNPIEEDAVVVEKILGMRMRTSDKDVDIENDDDTPEEEVEEFFVKYKNYSYLHCEWKTAAELERDKRIQSKIKRYKMKKLQTNNYFAELDDEELFNADYVEVDRVLEVSITTDPVTEEDVTHFLVKWRALTYEESTWELQQDVDPEKVKMFYRFKDPPNEEERQHKPKPKSDEWEKREQTREYKGGNTLREYQLEGVNWLQFSWYNGQNCILADEMGLGKTIQSITFLYEILVYGIRGPFLVVVPLSTLGNWQREFETWTDMNAIVYHGSSISRNMLQQYEMFYRDENGKKIPDLYKFNALITTYEIIISDCEILSDIDWRCLIIDEAHRLKNKNCRLMEGLRLFDCEHRVLLTGTPLQNNVEELFSLLNFLEPERFNNSQSFMTDFGDLKTDSQVEKLKTLLKPMMLRRLKEDVEKNLAAKEETIVEVELTNIQKKYYRAILERNFSFLSKGTGSSTNVPNLLNTMMELRKCCNHPYLIKGAEDKIVSEVREKQDSHPETIFVTMVQSSGKLVLMDKLLPKLKQNGHKVLIFSQMIRVLDILEDYLIHKKHLYERLDGRIRGNLRQEAIDRFSKPDSDRFVFLLCTRAGGLGINLTAADTVIIYDSDWNPQNDLQAQARCHRIGQQKAVKVYRLVTRNSYEREMFDRASMKLGLDKAVLQSMGGEKAVNPQAQMSKKEIEELLRKGAYGALMEDDSAGDKFCEEDIDQILQRRTQVIQIESEGKGSTFAKASFSMSDNRDDIDINDPNFWQKWAKKADIDMDELKNKNELIIQEPRQRKQTARYGNDEAVMDISDLESSSDSGEDEESGGISGHPGKGKKGKRGRRRNKDSDNDYEGDELNGEGYNRSECFKVEKNLLVYGWGRWIDIISHGRFKRRLEEKDVEMISRALLIYSLQHYKGDEKIKDFIWDLVSPSNDGSLKNHSGLSAPVPRGRKGKNKKKEPVRDPALEMERSKIDLDPEVVLRDGGYRRHLHRHANKVLLRVRLLYYIKQEIIGDEAQKVFQGYPSIEIDIPPPCADGEPPTPWWDEDADRSLLVGVFKHGYEKFNAMRSDPQLVFLARCGPPDSAALAAEQNEDNDDMDDTQGNLSMAKILDVDEEASVSSASEAVEGQKSTPVSVDGDSDKGIWPTPSDLNTRLRRIITGYQRNHKRQQIKNAQRARKLERTHKLEAAIKERESQRRQYQQCRWSRREEADFYRVISSYGIEFDLHTGRYKWDRFRILARLEKKYDETLAEYFQAFYHMCMRVCKKFKNDDDALPPNNIYVEPITEERASRCLARIDLLNKIRTEILHHPKFEERVKLCQSSYDLPRWWMCGKHDKDLVLGAARHGVVRTDYNILYDPALSFKEIVKNKFLQVSSPYHSSSPSNLNPDTPLKEKDEETEESKDGEPTIKKEMKEEKTVKEEDKDIKEEDTEVKEEVESAEVKKENGNKHELEEDDENDDENMDIQETQSIKEEVKKEENEEESKIKTEHSAEHSTKADLEVKEELKSEVKEELMDTEPSSEIKEEVKENGHLEEEEMKPLELVKKEKESMRKEDKYDERKTEKCDKKEEKCDIKKMEKSDRDTVNDEVIDMVKRIKEKEELLLMERRFSREDEELQRFMPDDADFDGASGEQNAISAAIQWPKDRVIFHRLEHICYCVEHGEWPFPKRMSYIPSNYDSRSGTPMGSSTPKDDADQSQSDAGDSIYDGVKVMNRNTLSDKDFEVEMTEGDGLKMTFHRRADKIGQKKFDMEGELGSRVQQILNQSKGSAASSDNESPSDLGSGVTPRSQTPAEMLPNGTPGHPELDPVLLNRSLMEHALMFPERRRRGRKRKAEKMAEIAMAEALARRQQARALATLEPDSHVPVINLEDGSRISGDEAPTKKDLDRWLDEHPGYMVDRPPDEEEEFIEEPQERRRGRRPRVDPALLDPSRLTGDENVSVVNRLTGKKITGAKAPPLKYLGEWLEQNPFFDVDPKWADLVKSNAKLPKSLLSRVVSTERRGRGRPRENILSQSVLAGENPFTSMAGLTGLPGSPLTAFHKLPLGMPFGAFPPLGMANPMLGLGFMPGLSSPLSKVSESDSKKDKSPNKKDTGSKVDSKSSSSATTTPHPSFPLMYNPLMFNPILAAQGLGFSLPSSLPTSFASLAHVNGQGDSDLEEGEIKRFSHSSERKRDHDRDRDQDMAQDLSMKRESSHHPHKRRREDKHGHHVKSSSSSSVSSKSLQQDEPTDLSMKSSSSSSSKTLTSPSNPSSKSSPVALTSKPQDLTKTKTKIQSSHKLSKIVDSLKSKVNKMEDKTKDKKSKLDNILRKLSKDSDSGEPSPTKSTSSMVSPNSSFIEEPKENVQKMLNMSESKSEDEKVTDDDVGVPLDDSLADDDEEKVMSDS